MSNFLGVIEKWSKQLEYIVNYKKNVIYFLKEWSNILIYNQMI